MLYYFTFNPIVMRDLRSYFSNPFFNIKFGFLIRLLFVKDCLKRLQQNSPGAAFAPLITQLENAIAPFEIEVRKMDTNEQKYSTATVEEVIALFISAGQDLNSFTSYKYGKNGAKLGLFFPKKMAELYKAGREDISMIVARWKKAITDNIADFSNEQDLVDKIAAIEEAWNTATDKQSGAKSIKKSASVNADMLWGNVTNILFDILLKFVELNRNNSDIVDLYFDASIVNSRTNKDNDGKGNLLLHLTDNTESDLNGYDIFVTDHASFAKTVTTNATGEASVKNLPTGNYHIQVRKNNAILLEKDLEVYDDNEPMNELSLA